MTTLSLIIRNATSWMETGKPGFRGDVRNSRRSYCRCGAFHKRPMCRPSMRAASVAPGFVELHTHYDLKCVGIGWATRPWSTGPRR